MFLRTANQCFDRPYTLTGPAKRSLSSASSPPPQSDSLQAPLLIWSQLFAFRSLLMRDAMKTVGHVLANNFRRRHCWRLMCCVGFVCLIVCLLFSPYLHRYVGWKDNQTPSNNIQTAQSSLSSFTLHPHHYESLSRRIRRTPGINQQLVDIQKNLTGIPPGIPQVSLKGRRCSDGPERPSENITESFEWQRVTPGQDDIFVFSAHYDRRDDRASVVITGISSNYMGASSAYMCRVWFASSAKAEVCSADQYSHTENHARR